jgi:purine nucleosidase
MQKFLIDVDTGADDSIALLYALNKPDVEIVGITTGCVNVDVIQSSIIKGY